MPTKIVTDQPQGRRRTLQMVLSASMQTLIEAPYFSVPIADEDRAIVDPANPNRELRGGEIFFSTGIQIANTEAAIRTVRVELVGEGGGPITSLSPDLVIPPKEVLTLAPGLSLFKRNLANPNAAGMIVRASASGSGLQLTTTVLEREAIEHDPDSEQ